jgi:hypothetical protein
MLSFTRYVPVRASNPWAVGSGKFPYFASGLGSQYRGYLGYYDTKPMATSTLYAPNGSATFVNDFTYGSLNTAGTVTISANIDRPGCVLGLTHPGQVGAYDETGTYSLCTQLDSVPIMADVPGTYTATSFSPSTPLVLSSTVRMGVGMWVRTNDSPVRFNGQVTSWATDAQGRVTQINVSQWTKRGGGAGTPTGTRAFINPLDKLWGHLNTPILNGILLTGTTTAGQTGIVMNTVVGLYPQGTLISGPGIPVNSVIAGIDYGGKTIYIEKPATASGTVSILASTGTEYGKAVAAEIDIFHNGPDFVPTWIDGSTATVTAGSYKLTNVTNIGQWRSGINVFGAGIPVGTIVTEVGTGDNTLTMKQPATGSGSLVALKAIHQLDEGGTGHDMVGVGGMSNTGYLVRGSWMYGYKSSGASDTAFLLMPDFGAGQPKYGFRVDGRINGMPTLAAFAVMDHTATYWSIDGVGNEKARSVDSATDYKIAGVTVLDNLGRTPYTPVITCGSGALTALNSATGYYRQNGKQITWSATVNVGAKGTCAGFLGVSMPRAANTDYPAWGREGASTQMVMGILPGGSSTLLVQKYDGTFPITVTDQSTILISTTYDMP